MFYRDWRIASAIFNRALPIVALVGVSAAAVFAAPAFATPLNLVTNGSFENTPGFNPGNGAGQTGSAATSSNLPGWQFTSCQSSCQGSSQLFSFILQPNYTTAGIYDGEDHHYTTFAGGGPGVSPDGGNAYTADGGHEVGTMSQLISGLNIGDTYQLSFYQASMQQTGYPGSFNADWQVSLGGQTQASATMYNPSQSYTGWTQQTLDFTATTASEALAFMATASNGNPPFLLLDGVSLSDVSVPEPASLGLLAAGLAGLVVMRQKRRAK